MVLSALGLLAGLASAGTLELRGPVEVDAPKPRGEIVVTAALYDSPTGGRLLWKSDPFKAEAFGWRWVFKGTRGAAAKELLAALRSQPYAQFESGGSVFKPRQPFHRAPSSTDWACVLEPGAAPPVAAAGTADIPLPSDSDEAIEVGGGSVGLLAVTPDKATPSSAPWVPPAGGTGPRQSPTGPSHEPSLVDLRLSNDLYFQGLREYRTGNAPLALAKLDVALKLNPGNSEARLVLERIKEEGGAAPVPRAAAPRPEAVRAAQDLYFEALRHYGNGRLEQAQEALARAAQADPSDPGIATALLRLRRELALMPHVLN